MQLQQLKYFVAVADTRHFTQAANQTGVTQPSLSKQIHALETTLGTALFTRTRGAITLTQAGETLLPLARRILADAETARLEVAELIGLQRGRLRLGATPSLCTSLVPPVLRRFRDHHPRIALHITESGSHDLADKLARGDLDQALIVTSATESPLDTEPILRESLVVASATPIVGKPSIDLAELSHEPLVMFREGYDLRDTTLDAFHNAGLQPQFAIEGGEMDAVLGFVAAGLGVAIVPSMVLSGRSQLHATPLAAPGIQRTIALAHRRDVTPTHAAAAMREQLLRYLIEASIWGRLPTGVSIVEATKR